MKYIVLVPDGMADYPVAELGNRTPLEAARTPNMDYIARQGRLGRVKTIPDNMIPASDVANISILGYDPKRYYTGRGPLEAANLGIEMEYDDVAFRCNLVTIANDIMIDYSAGHISSKEASVLVKAIDRELGNDKFKFYPGISYRHLLLVKKGADQQLENINCSAPHDITDLNIAKHLPKGKNSEIIIDLMRGSRKVLEAHEINHVRIDLKENPANMIWLWGQGKRPDMPKFSEKYQVSGSVISAVDLIKGLGRIIGLNVINVAGATGYYDTDYKAKANAALRSLEDHDFVFVHVEAPDEAGHNGDLREKITAIERFDQLVVGTILEAFKRKKNFKIMILPDHATPVSLKTHTSDIICFGIFGKGVMGRGFLNYSEKEAEKSDLYFDKGHELMDYFIKS
ncbi:MAG: cofactor-independent phosphoglycerate mutase [Candidatus Omnitrophota bacterium]|nr:cofactor-independent phosphoglycerate mutase [Candidatus Omnitrophota bacterium]MBU1929214.1 cofactor-independent phosphoglycerate mutase [Candidatus Omnitrophota bacterium]MBU2034537.1 cofactor-independent phosphoglycerate mutase [Candidatus Omnitrophota bacterium]